MIVFWLIFNIFITFLSILYFLCYHILITNKKFYAKDSEREGGGMKKHFCFTYSHFSFFSNNDFKKSR
ncbi:hypothetical protein A0Y62_03460 [Campylobacter lari]|nr:hypothetical protein CONCH_0134 [Campylobacter lari subsp. concheus LMG 11760]EAL3899057.1 hypothetical protein [Campylobacter lari]